MDELHNLRSGRRYAHKLGNEIFLTFCHSFEIFSKVNKLKKEEAQGRRDTNYRNIKSRQTFLRSGVDVDRHVPYFSATD